GGGMSGLALAYLLHKDGLLAAENNATCNSTPLSGNPYAPKTPHFKARAKAVISLFMTGGPSHVDTFDPKPALARYAGQPLTGKGDINVRQGWPGPLMPSPFQFRKYGQSGIEVSEIFPNLAQHVDEMAILRSVYARSNDHVQSTYELQSRHNRRCYRAMGTWVTYGHSSETDGLPAVVRIPNACGATSGGESSVSVGVMPTA